MVLTRFVRTALMCVPSGLILAVHLHAQSGLDLTAVDSSVSPCDNFYQYACGGWMKNNPIPSDESSWGRFNVLNESNEKILRGLLEDSAAHIDRSETDQKIGALYNSCMDEAKLNELGKQPLIPELERISKITDSKELLAEVAHLQLQQAPVLFNFASSVDPDNAKQEIADLVAHISKMFQLLGEAPASADKKAATVMTLETALAKVSLDVTSRRDPKNVTHKLTIAQLNQLSPDFNFTEYFAAMGAPKFQTLNVDVPGFTQGLGHLLQTHALQEWKD